MMAVLGFIGVSFREDGIGLNPQFPDAWTGLRVPLQWRGRRLAIAIDAVGRTLSIGLKAGEAMAVHACGTRYLLEPGETLIIPMPTPSPAAGRFGHAAL